MTLPARAALVAALAVTCIPAFAQLTDPVLDRDAVERFATLPDGVRFPEGIAANPRTGDIFVGTFDFGAPNKLLRFNANGSLAAIKDFDGAPLLGLAFDAAHGVVFIANFGASSIQRIAAGFDAQTPVQNVATLPSIGAPANRTEGNPDGSSDSIKFGSAGKAAPNGLLLDAQGTLYVSDSFQGAIFRIRNAATCSACAIETVIQDPLLATAGFPPFGANGLAFDRTGGALYIANTGDDRVLKLDLASKKLTVFTESVNGADGLATDADGSLWIAANQADELVRLNDTGRVTAKLGDFKGIDRTGAPRGLLFPASIAVVWDWMYVTNLALPLTDAKGDEPEEQVTRWTVSRVRVPQR